MLLYLFLKEAALKISLEKNSMEKNKSGFKTEQWALNERE